MDVKEISISELFEYENNPRCNSNAVDAVAASIKEFGFKVPLIIDSDHVIIAGHTRLKAAKSLGLDTVPCVIADDLTPDQAKALRLADNKVSEIASWDYNALNKELAELSDYELNLAQFGFEIEWISPDDFGTDFSLPEGDKGEFEQISLTLHREQAELVRYAMSIVGECSETFGNTNKNGNAIYEVVRQWAEQKR